MTDPYASTMDYAFHDWRPMWDKPGRESKTWMDPCPACQAEVQAVHAVTHYVIYNPGEVIGNRHPDCTWDPDNPDSEECRCGPAIVNPYPNPLDDVRVPTGTTFHLKPCGHTVPTVQLYTRERAAPGTLGALYEDVAEANRD